MTNFWLFCGSLVLGQELWQNRAIIFSVIINFLSVWNNWICFFFFFFLFLFLFGFPSCSFNSMRLINIISLALPSISLLNWFWSPRNMLKHTIHLFLDLIFRRILRLIFSMQFIGISFFSFIFIYSFDSFTGSFIIIVTFFGGHLLPFNGHLNFVDFLWNLTFFLFGVFDGFVVFLCFLLVCGVFFLVDFGRFLWRWFWNISF